MATRCDLPSSILAKISHPSPAFGPLVGAAVLTAEMDPADASVDCLHPRERAQVAHAVVTRRRQHAAGRILSRVLLGRLGHPDWVLVSGADRVPRWPDSLRASITHVEDRAAVVATIDRSIGAIGCDIEEAAPLPADVDSRVNRPCERTQAWSGEPGLLGRVLFSAKEAAYKAQYPISRRRLDFDAMIVHLGRGPRGRFEAELVAAVPPFRTGDVIEGRFTITSTHVATVATIASVLPRQVGP